MPKSNHRRIATFSLAALLNDIGSDMIKPLWPTFVTAVLGAPMAFLGLLDGLGRTVGSMSMFPSGYFADKTRRKPFIWVGYLFSGLARIGYALAAFATALLPLYVIDRLGKGLRDPPRDAMLAEAVKKRRRGRAFGILRAADSFGATLGPLIAFFLFAAAITYRNIFLIAAVPSIIGATLIYIIIKEGRKKERAHKRKFKFRGLTRNLKFLIAIAGIFALSWFSISFMIVYATRFMDVLYTPLVFFFFSLFASMSAIPAGKLSDKIGRKPVAFMGFGLYTLVCAGFIFSNSAAMIFFLFMLFGVHYGILRTMEKTFVADLAPKAIRATALGSYQTTVGLAALPASLIAGLLWDNISAVAPFYYGAVLSAIAAVLLLIFVKDTV